MTVILPSSQWSITSQKCNLKFVLDNRPITCIGKIKEVEQGKTISYVTFEISATTMEESMEISSYLSAQQMKITKELKNKIYNQNYDD